MSDSFAPGVGPLVDPTRWCSHYTSLETALEHILHTNTLRLSPLAVVNDPKESGSTGWMGGSIPVSPDKLQDYVALESEVDRLLRSRVKVLCMCLDANEHPQGLNRSHFKPRMWAQYGGRGRGVCLVLHRDRLASQLRSDESSLPIVAAVKYTDHAQEMMNPPLSESDLLLTAEELARTRFQRFHDPLVFMKHLDWVSESELRLACYSDKPGYQHVPIGDSIAAIVVGPDFPPIYRPIVELEARKRGVPALRLRWNASNTAYERWA